MQVMSKFEKGYLRHLPSSFCPRVGNISFCGLLVVEKANILLNEGDAQLLGRLEDGLVVLATAWRRNVLDS